MNSPVDELKPCPICKGDGYAAEGELSAIKKWIEDNRAPEPYDFSDDPHGEFQPMGDDNDIVYADVLLEFISALQSRSTPPPVAGGDVDYCAMFTSLCEGLEIDPAIVGVSTLAGIKAVGKAIASQAKSAALQHQGGVCMWKWQDSGCFVTTSCGEELFIEEGSDYIPKFCQCCGKRAQQQSLERNNGQK